MSPNGSQIVVALAPRSGPSNLDLAIVDVASHAVRRLQIGAGLGASPDWSPDGATIASESFSDGGIQLAAPDSSVSRPLTAPPDRATDLYPRWSPDGSRIAFLRMAAMARTAQLTVVDVDGAHERRLSEQPCDLLPPAWSPDGSRLAFTVDRSGTPMLAVVGADGSGERLRGRGYAPQWQPTPS